MNAFEMPIYIPFFLQYCALSKLAKRYLESHIPLGHILDVQQSVDSEFIVKLYKQVEQSTNAQMFHTWCSLLLA